jgi:hypothetical protein
MASSRGLARPNIPLDKKQEAFVLKNMGKRTLKAIAADLGVSPQKVTDVAERNGFRGHLRSELPHIPDTVPAMGSRTRCEWLPEEDKLIMEHYPVHGQLYVSLLLGRTKKATGERARRLGMVERREPRRRRGESSSE